VGNFKPALSGESHTGADILGTDAKSTDPIAWTPVHSLDLPLQNLDLAPQSQDFRLQLGSIAVAGRQRIQQEAQERVDDRADHPAGNPI
jgi:hypothetical protein